MKLSKLKKKYPELAQIFGSLDLRKMKERCLADEKEFFGLGVKSGPDNNFHVYIRRPGAKILGVAHLDTVQTSKHFYSVLHEGKPTVFNAQLDDRLGAYMLLDWLPAHGVLCDVLLTTGEEVGHSTAGDFVQPSDVTYNWMFQFDRAGDDVVCYDYEEDILVDRLESVGYKVGIGSFSDICWLEHLNILGFNIGVGYHHNHSIHSHARLDETLTNAYRFVNFYKSFENVQMPYVPKPKKYGGFRGRYGYMGGYEQFGAEYGYSWNSDKEVGIYEPNDYVWFRKMPYVVLRQSYFTTRDTEPSYWVIPSDSKSSDVSDTDVELAKESELSAISIVEAEKLQLKFVEKSVAAPRAKPLKPYLAPPKQSLSDRPRSPKYLLGAEVNTSKFGAGRIVSVDWQNDGLNAYLYGIVPFENDEQMRTTRFAWEEEITGFVRNSMPDTETNLVGTSLTDVDITKFSFGDKVMTPAGLGIVACHYPIRLMSNLPARSWLVEFADGQQFYYVGEELHHVSA